MVLQLAQPLIDGSVLNRPTPLVPTQLPRPRRRPATSRPASSMTCPECGLGQAVALDCVGCGRIMNPGTDFSMPLPSGEAADKAMPAESKSPDRSPSFVPLEAVSEESGLPWVEMLGALFLAWLAWDLHHRLSVFEASMAPLGSLPIWARMAYGTVGKEASVVAALMFGFLLLLRAARQVINGR